MKILIISLISILFIIPYYWMVVVSLEPDSRGTNPMFHLIPQNMTFEHYIFLFTKVKMVFRYLFNSLFISVADVIITCLTASMAGYVLAKKLIPFAEKTFMILLVCMAIPANILLLPRYILMKDLNLINTYIAMFIVIGPSSVFLMKQVIQTIPDSMIESARIDGANEWQIFTGIILPLIKPALIALGIFTFIGTYNNYFWQLLMVSSPEMKTFPLVVSSFAGASDPQMQLTMASAVIASLPMISCFVIFHKNFIEGIRIGGVKE